MPTFIIAESGSTKTDWCLVKDSRKPQHFKTSGINPNLQSPQEVAALLERELTPQLKKGEWAPERLFFYGSGTGNPQRQKELMPVIKKYFGIREVEIHTDMMASARGLCGNTKGVISILGTGSNSCYYNGRKIAEQMPSLGYIAGDEGSGNHMGKRVLQYYAYNTFDNELRLGFEMMFGNDLHQITHQLYKEPFPNRYLASFCQLLINNRGHYMVENIVEDCINEFFHHHILKYRQSWKFPLHFTGTIAYEFRDVIEALCHQYELEVGTIARTPLDGLITFHKNNG